MARVLLVDDDVVVRETLGRVLATIGHEAIQAADGNEGLRLLREHGAEAAIVDLFMPHRDGIEIILEIRRFGPSLPIIAISGGALSRQLDMLDQAKKLGAVGGLEKPFTRDELLVALELALGDGAPLRDPAA
jgi:CheY-like chemotaxis protein